MKKLLCLLVATLSLFCLSACSVPITQSSTEPTQAPRNTNFPVVNSTVPNTPAPIVQNHSLREEIISALGYDWDPENPIVFGGNATVINNSTYKSGFFSAVNGSVIIEPEFIYASDYYGEYAFGRKKTGDLKFDYFIFDKTGKIVLSASDDTGNRIDRIQLGDTIRYCMIDSNNNYCLLDSRLNPIAGELISYDTTNGFYAIKNAANLVSIYNASDIKLFDIDQANEVSFSDNAGHGAYCIVQRNDNGEKLFEVMELPNGNVIFSRTGIYDYSCSHGAFTLFRSWSDKKAEIVAVLYGKVVFNKTVNYITSVGAHFCYANEQIRIRYVDGTNERFEFYSAENGSYINSSTIDAPDMPLKLLRNLYLLKENDIDFAIYMGDESYSCIWARVYLGVKAINGYGIRLSFIEDYTSDTRIIKLINDRSMETLFEHEFVYYAGPFSGANYEKDIPFFIIKDTQGNWTIYNLITKAILEINKDNNELYLKEAGTNYFYFEDRSGNYYLYNFDLQLIRTGKKSEFQN